MLVPHCVQAPKDVLHALQGCKNLLQVLSSEFKELATTNNQFCSFADLFRVLIENQSNLERFATACWMIWNRRNKVRVQQSVLPLDRLSFSARDYLSEFQKLRPKAAKHVQPVKRIWKPLDKGKVKANFDEAMFDELNEVDIGVAIINPQGVIMAALSKKYRSHLWQWCLRHLLLDELLILFMKLDFKMLSLRVIQKYPSRWYFNTSLLWSVHKRQFVLCQLSSVFFLLSHTQTRKYSSLCLSSESETLFSNFNLDGGCSSRFSLLCT